ncbi:MAG: ABC transporter ATP-binding protein/permease [Pseudomonadota bacterium]
MGVGAIPRGGLAAEDPKGIPDPDANPTPPNSETRQDDTLGVLAQAFVLLRAVGQSPGRRSLTMLSLAIALIIGANAVGQIYLNDWRGAWYDALEQRNLDAFFLQLQIFLVIVGFLLAMVVGETWLHQMVRIRLRQWLTHDLLNVWLHPKRVALLGHAGEIGINPDQRMHEDARHLSELTVALGIGLLRSSLMLVSFVGVLWVLSEQVRFTWGGTTFAIPGYMVWCVLIYAFLGSWLTWLVGRPLIRLNAVRYSREADLRFAMVRVNENAEAIAFFRGETQERNTLNRPVDRVVDITRQLAGSLARLTWITSGFGWSGLVVPILVAAPGYFSGYMSFGGMMIVVGAFNQVENSLSWFVSNFSNIADWRATLLRVTTFRTALLKLDAEIEAAPHATMTPETHGQLVLQNLDIVTPDRIIRPAESRITIDPGQHTLIQADPGGGGKTMFRALAGLWPEGSGTIHLPENGTIMFVPQKPYIPLGTIASAALYPQGPDAADTATIVAALQQVGLDHLVSELDTVDRWDHSLSLDEQQRLVLARCLLNAPDWLVLEDFLASMDETNRALMLAMLENELAGTTVICVGTGIGLEQLALRTIALESVPTQVRSSAATAAGQIAQHGWDDSSFDRVSPKPTTP